MSAERLTGNQVLKLFRDINVWKKGGERAPHKPLLLLYALGRLGRGDARSLEYKTVDHDLRELLTRFGPPRATYHTEYPFWRLRNDGIWEVSDSARLKKRRSNNDPLKSELLRLDVSGGFTAPVLDVLERNGSLRTEIARVLLESNFPDSMHDDILAAVGLDLTMTRKTRPRDPEFRTRVIRAYQYRCAVCDFDLRLGQSDICLEAAHIKWHQAGGPDEESNGLALCAMHHKMLDRGALTLSPERRVLVSESVHGRSGLDEWLLTFHGKPISQPQRTEYVPDEQFIHWHGRQVFRHPARQV
jgi:putative restriction endonuclease